MVFSSEDKIFIRNLVLLKGYSSRWLIKEFPQKGWNKNGLDVLLQKIQKTASVDRQPGSRRPRSVRTPENIYAVNDLVLSEYYKNVLLMEKMLPVIWGMSSDFFIFQQDSAPAHRAKDTIALLRRETQSFIGPELWPANSPDLNPVDYRFLGLIQERVYQTAIRNIYELKERLIIVWAELKQSVIAKLLNSGGQG